MNSSVEKLSRKLTLAVITVWVLVLVAILAFVLWWIFGIERIPDAD